MVGARGRTYTPATGRSAKPDTTKNLTMAYGYTGLTEASPGMLYLWNGVGYWGSSALT